MSVAWTTPAAVQAALGPSVVFDTDPFADAVVEAANDWCFRKRAEAGYADVADDDAPAPSGDVAMGATLYAVSLWRERGSTDGFQSFEDLAGFTPVAGTSGRVRQLLGVGRGQVDANLTGLQVNALRAGRRIGGWRW